jgi:hypothetical protein
MKKISTMTWVKMFLVVTTVGTIVFFVCKWSVTLDQPPQIKPIFKTETLKVVSEKEKWFNSLNTNICSLVGIIDSLPTNNVLEDIVIKARAYGEIVPTIIRTSEGIWEEVQPEDLSWSDNVYNEESGELLKTNRFKGHIGNAYLRSIHKEDIWKRVYGNEDGFFSKEYVFQYGVLLKPDTIDKKIYPAGTYVATCLSTKEEFNQNKKQFKYFSNYEKFLNFVLKNIDSSKEPIEISPYTAKILAVKINL